LINQILCRGDRRSIEGGDPTREDIDKAVQLRVRECPVDVSVSFRGIAVEVVRAEDDFERAATADQQREALRAAAAGIHSHPDLGLAQSRVFARREAHVAGEDELATHASDAASDLRDADHRGLGKTDERVQQDRKAGRPNGRGDIPRLTGQIEVGPSEICIQVLDNARFRPLLRQACPPLGGFALLP
jgi:hypothetical protein